MRTLLLRLLFLLIASTLAPVWALASSRGIYLTQSTAENTPMVKSLIQQARASGVDTFVVDVGGRSSTYQNNIGLMRANGIHYVARVVVFPLGGSAAEVKSRAVWDKRWQQILYALNLGAHQIQLDYIRYTPKQPASAQNAVDVHQVIQYFRQKMANVGASAKLQTDIFGIVAMRPGLAIGQDARLFAHTVDALCPMVYPSHYDPQPTPSQQPYKTVYSSIAALKKQLVGHPNTKVYAYIELSNYRYPMTPAQRVTYIKAEIKAALDAGADGWYAWSAANQYQLLFSVLKGGGV